jgi:Transglycosylase-like domain
MGRLSRFAVSFSRACAFVAGAIVGFAIGTAVLVTHADDVRAAAAEAGVDVVALRGAVNSTGLAPRVYLYAVGELEHPPLRPPTPPPPRPPSAVWDRLAVCEATSNWAANTGNGYYGGLQFDLPTWRMSGGTAYAPRPDLATRTQQIAAAERLSAMRGFAPWPVCSRRMGLR